MSKGMSRKWGGKSLQNLFLNSKENMKQQHIASVNSSATVLETAVYINVLAHITECIALDSSPKDRNRVQLCCYYPFNKKTVFGLPYNCSSPGRACALRWSV